MMYVNNFREDALTKMIYLIMSGEYSDQVIHGYMLDKIQAEKYCAKKNMINQERIASDLDYEYDDEGNYEDIYSKLYIVEIEDMAKRNLDVSDVELRYYHTVIFDFKTGMRYEPDRYDVYTGTIKSPMARYDDRGICFEFDCKNRKLAEKIAQDKYAMFMSLYHETGSYDYAAQSMGVSKNNDYYYF